MGKNVVICADGTGNSFGRSVSNVARMIRLLALDDRSRQVVVYDQGIGTDARRWKEILDFRRTIVDAEALHVLRGTLDTRSHLTNSADGSMQPRGEVWISTAVWIATPSLPGPGRDCLNMCVEK